MKESPINETEMADIMRQEQVFLTPGKKRTKVQPQQEVRDIHDRQILDKLSQVLKELNRNRFFGDLLIKFESGHIVLIKKTQCIKLSAQPAG